jgi:polar amino acid transport system permease protein
MRSSASTSRGSSRRREATERALVTAAVLLGIVGFLAATGPSDGWDFRPVWGDADDPAWRPTLLSGLLLTLGISVGALALALPLGLAGGLARLSRRAWLRQVGAMYVEVVRGTPLLVQIFIGFYCVGWALGTDDRALVGTVTLAVFAGAYVTEIVRAAVESVDPGQAEAALSQGMTRGQAMRRVVLPQAWRRMLPPLAGEAANVVKDSSLLSVLGVLELTKRAQDVGGQTFKTFEIYLPVALLYLAITFPLSRFARRLETRAAAA